ncbi:hypothetical protein FKW77_008973 [Venturia effusa]|uniref:MoaB/Mog domain-containing protein n=1 Tax=Venturia effusa TaxID=50376 RepID=A0A517LCU3_9PEZI|nr:hypothetical protein FKW77_008973 [Venturia effusa]
MPPTPTQTLRAAILIVSDTAFADNSSDKAGPTLQGVFTSNVATSWDVAETRIVPDDVLEIQRAVMGWCDGGEVNCVVTSGGTGFARRDLTPEAIEPLLHRKAPGLVHGMLAASLEITPFAMMSRPVAGVRNKTLIITLPGSPKGAKENLEAVIKLLHHACVQAAGADSRIIHAGGVKKLEKDAGVASFKSMGNVALASESHSHSHDHSHGHSHDHSHGGGHRMPIAHTKTDERPQQSNDPSAGPTRRYRKSPYPMLSVDEALSLISQNTPQPQTIKVAVNEALIGYVLAEDVRAAEAVPAFRASIVDGYAIKIPTSGVFEKGIYPVSMVSHAQAVDLHPLEEGKIARITTGAPLPPGADAVVMVEDTILQSMTEDGKEEREVEILTSEIKAGENVREVGSDVEAGSVILRKGEGISAVGGEFGLLASVGTKEVGVYKKPVIGILSTGDEIVPHDREGGLKMGEVRDTNRPTLITAVKGTGFEALDLGIVSDKPGALESTLRTSLGKVDVLITTGGVSMGELDLLKPTIERSLGGCIHFGRVSMKPGKPTTFATVPIKSPITGEREDRLVFSLPGNPASAVVTFMLFVLPSLHQWAGVEPRGLRRVRVVLGEDVRCDGARAEFARCVVGVGKDGVLNAVTTGGQRSSRIGSFKGANGLLALPVKSGFVKKGESCDALIMGPLVGL